MTSHRVLEIGVGAGGNLFPSLYMLAGVLAKALEPALEEFEGIDFWGPLNVNTKEFFHTYPKLDRNRPPADDPNTYSPRPHAAASGTT